MTDPKPMFGKLLAPAPADTRDAERAAMLADLVGAFSAAITAAAERAAAAAGPRSATVVSGPAPRPRSWRFEIRRDGGLITEIIATPEEPQP